MARIYAPNEEYDRKGIGVEFYHGAAASAVDAVISNLEARGYSIDESTDLLSIYDKLPKDELQSVALSMGIEITKVVEEETVYKTKQELVADIETFADKGVLPYVTNVASGGLTNLVLTFSEALYEGSVAVVDGADLKAKFVASAGVTITSAIYTAVTKVITFIIADAAENATLTYTGDSIKDAAGGILSNLSFTAGVSAWGVTE